MHDGTVAFEFESLEQGTLKRDPSGHLAIAAYFPPQAAILSGPGGGQSDYDEHNTAGGLIMPQFDVRTIHTSSTCSAPADRSSIAAERNQVTDNRPPRRVWLGWHPASRTSLSTSDNHGSKIMHAACRRRKRFRAAWSGTPRHTTAHNGLASRRAQPPGVQTINEDLPRDRERRFCQFGEQIGQRKVVWNPLPLRPCALAPLRERGCRQWNLPRTAKGCAGSKSARQTCPF
jgi:hypothetical protein